MKRKEDAEQRKQEEEEQRQIAQQGHWQLVSRASVAKQQPKFRVEYDGGLGVGPAQATAGAARHIFGKFAPSTADSPDGTMQVEDTGREPRDKRDVAVGKSSSAQKRPRE